jgi:hypothetical protein
MNDVTEFIKLIKAGYCCISIVTHEETEALDVVRRAAKNLEYHMQIWSAGRGVRDGHYPVFSLESTHCDICEGLQEFASGPTKTLYVLLDAARYLDSTINLRMLRDAISRIELNKSVLVLIDSEDKLPEVVKSYCRPF